VSEVIGAWSSTHTADRQHPAKTSTFSLPRTHTFQIFQSFGYNYTDVFDSQ